MTHSECIRKLKTIGELLDFEPVSRIRGKMFELANPDCVWYYKGKGEEELRKIARGDKCDRLPFIAFEVAYSEQEKNLRGSMMSLQLTNASVSIIILLGKSVEYEPKLRKLVGRYSSTRFRIWTEKDVDELYNTVKRKYPEPLRKD